jgi:hypothetical protein
MILHRQRSQDHGDPRGPGVAPGGGTVGGNKKKKKEKKNGVDFFVID